MTNMITIKGKLEFISLWEPIKLDDYDLQPDFFRIFKNLNGKKTTMDYGMNHIRIFEDETAERLMEFEKNDKKDTILMVLRNINEWGMSNLGAYVPDILQHLNSMQVIVEYDDKSISIRHDETEKVFELKYTKNNSCKISDDKVKEICKIGERDCCIFVTVNGDGFTCEKFDIYMSRILLDRHREGTMRASRIGNCKLIGRIEDDKRN